MTGEDVLLELCRLTAVEVPDPDLLAATTPLTIAACLQERGLDVMPRRVVGRLRMLGYAGLAYRAPAARRLRSGRVRSYSRDAWAPTPRGREVDWFLAASQLDRLHPVELAALR